MTSGFDTIVAAATPVARSAIAVIRLDGPDGPNILLMLSGRTFEERLATYTVLSDAGGTMLDEAIVIRFVAPRSYTGNDLFEISIHGNPLLVDRVVREIVRCGARLAEAGEFTERAVLNGKLDLVQAESVAALIEARTAAQADLALSHLGGGLSELATRIHAELLELLTLLEGALDFADDGYEFISREECGARLRSILMRVEELLATLQRGRAIREGVDIVLLGRPNAGKSTMLNALLGEERAIVTPTAGTTRDIVAETITLAGIPVRVSDTAGIRETTDEVERLGVERARAAAAKAAIVVYLLDSSEERTAEDERELECHPDAIVVSTKGDIGTRRHSELVVSARTADGLNLFRQHLATELRERFALDERGPALTTLRQGAALQAAAGKLRAAQAASATGSSEEYVAADVYAAATALKELLGAVGAEEARREVFRRFCIGK